MSADLFRARNLLIEQNIQTLKNFPIGTRLVIYDVDSGMGTTMPRFGTIIGHGLNIFDELLIEVKVATRAQRPDGTFSTIEMYHPNNKMHVFEKVEGK